MLEDDEGGQIASHLPRDDTNTLEAAMDRFDGSRAVRVVQKLPDLYREVIVLRYIDSLTISEIAELIEQSENVVSVRIHRGLKRLRSLLDDEDKDKKAPEKNPTEHP
jgi:RNA polymerase sigma-70 factor (ECF subfamily)